jgi:hypothetical protein
MNAAATTTTATTNLHIYSKYCLYLIALLLLATGLYAIFINNEINIDSYKNIVFIFIIILLWLAL